MDTLNIENLIGYMIGKTTFAIKNNVHKLFKSKGYKTTPEQWGVLNLLETAEGLTQSEIAEKTTKDKANITRILDVMQKNGLIQRKKHEKDRRAYKIYLTEKGRNLQYMLARYVLEIDNLARRGVTNEELIELNRILEKIYANFHW